MASHPRTSSVISIICTKPPRDGRIDAPGLHVTYDDTSSYQLGFYFNLSRMDKRLDIQALRRWPSAFMHRHNSALPAHFRPDSWSGDDQDLASLEDIPSNITLQKFTSQWLQKRYTRP